MKKKAVYPTKTSMNLYYKPDRTTKPSTIALYVLFAVVIMLGLAKWMVYDLWVERVEAERARDAAMDEYNDVMLQLMDYNEVEMRYIRYSATDEEDAIVDRLEVLELMEEVAGHAGLYTITISGDRLTTQLTNVTLAQVSEIVKQLEASPMVSGTLVSTASTTGADGYGDVEGDIVQASLTVYLQKVETQYAEEAAEQ